MLPHKLYNDQPATQINYTPQSPPGIEGLSGHHAAPSPAACPPCQSTIKFSILTSTKGSTQKRLIPGPDGRPVKDPNHDLGIYAGQVAPGEVDSLAAFAEALAGLRSNQALTLGVTGSTAPQGLVTKAKRAAMTYKGDRIVARSLDYFSWPEGYFALLLDHDPEPGKPDITDDQLWARFCSLFPEFATAGRVVTVSSSSAIYDKTTGACLKPASGHHTFVIVKGDVERFKGILEARCWLHGEAFYKLGNPNKKTGVTAALERFLVDAAVFSPERLVYEAGAEIDPGAPFEQRKPAPKVVEGQYINLDAIPELTPAEQAQAAANRKQALDAIKPQRVATAAAHVATEQPDLTQAGAYAIARQRVRECDRGELLPDHQLYLADGRAINAGDIGAEHHEVKLRDPQEPDYRGGAINSIIYCDGSGGWMIHSQAHGGKNYTLAGSQKGKGSKATSTKAAARAADMKRAAAILKSALPKAHHETTGQYMELPTLPEGFSGYAVDAAMGSGKTVQIGHFVEGRMAQGEFTIELEPRNSLGEQAAVRHKLPHIHEFSTDSDSQKALGAMARSQGGAVLCPNSLPRLEQHLPQHGLNVVVDEAMATLTEAMQGGTLKKRFAETIEILFATLRRAKTIILSESGIDAATVAFVEGITQRSLFYVRHIGQPTKWMATHLSSAAALFHGLFSALEQGQRVWFCSTSKTEAHGLAIWAQQKGIKFECVSGDTNEQNRFDGLFTDPETWLAEQQLQLLITTQTVQTGLSVEGDWFDVVYGYGPGFAPDMLYQMTGRYRRPVPRFLWVPAFIQPQWWEKPQAHNARAEMDREFSQWCGTGFNPSHKDPDQALIDQYLAARGEIQWALKIAPRAGIKHLLENGGHTFVVDDSKLPTEIHQAVADTRSQYKEALAQQRATDHATAKLDPDVHTTEWFKNARARETTYLERCLLFKASCLEKFPGIDWDSTDVWYQSWFAPKEYDEGQIVSGPSAPGASLWAECEHLPHFETLDRDEVAVAMLARLRCAALLPTHSKKLAALAPLRPLCEQLLDLGVVKPGEPIVKRLATLARSVGEQLHRYLRITATDDQSDIAIACKVLRKFGLSVARNTMTSRKGAKGARQWEYKLTMPPMWRALVDARGYALKALQDKGQEVATDLLKTPYNKSVATSPDGIPPDDWADLKSMVQWAKAAGAAAMADLKATLAPTVGPQTWEVLTHAA